MASTLLCAAPGRRVLLEVAGHKDELWAEAPSDVSRHCGPHAIPVKAKGPHHDVTRSMYVLQLTQPILPCTRLSVQLSQQQVHSWSKCQSTWAASLMSASHVPSGGVVCGCDHADAPDRHWLLLLHGDTKLRQRVSDRHGLHTLHDITMMRHDSCRPREKCGQGSRGEGPEPGSSLHVRDP